LIEIGAYTMEEASSALSIKGERVNQWIIRKPVIIMRGEEDNRVPVILRTDEKYKNEDLIFDFMIEEEEVESKGIEVVEDDIDEDWLDELG
jgi:hypothetical protein